MNWPVEWAKQAKDITLSPVDFYRNLDERGDYKYPVKFAVTSAMISAFLVFIAQEAQIRILPDPTIPAELTGITGLALLLISGIIGGTIGLLINSGFIHIFVSLFGFKDYQKTTEAVSYPTGISALLSWIPVVNIVAFFYMIYAEIRGVESIHEMSTGKAAASVILGTVLLGVIIFSIFIGLAFFAYSFTEPVGGEVFETTLQTVL